MCECDTYLCGDFVFCVGNSEFQFGTQKFGHILSSYVLVCLVHGSLSGDYLTACLTTTKVEFAEIIRQYSLEMSVVALSMH